MLTPLAASVLYLAPVPATLSSQFLDAFPLMALALITSAFVTALLYMVGNMLQSQDVLGAAKDNLGALLFAMIVVLMFLSLFQIFATLANAIAGVPDSYGHVELAEQSILILRSKLFSLYSHLYLYEMLFGFLSTLGFSIPVPAIFPADMFTAIISMPSVSFSPLSGLTPLSNAHTIIVEAVGTALLMVLSRQVVVEFIGKYIYMFFVLGVGLRAFSFTRRTGASVLALCAVAYFVYPLAVLFTNYLIFNAYMPADFGTVPTTIGMCNDPEDVSRIREEMSSERQDIFDAHIDKDESFWYQLVNFFISAANFVVESISMAINVALAFNFSLLWYIILAPVMFGTFYDFLLMEIQTLVQFLVLTFVCFFLEIVITITMYRAAASFMEGETEIFGISKLM